MEIVCNGEKRDIRSGTTIEELLAELGVAPDTIFVECDGVIVKRDEYPSFVVTEGAKLELIRFVGGG
ncbi:MAG: sulfur carrier protein ThiS [Thermodesulfobacteriota bacterium]